MISGAARAVAGRISANSRSSIGRADGDWAKAQSPSAQKEAMSYFMIPGIIHCNPNGQDCVEFPHKRDCLCKCHVKNGCGVVITIHIGPGINTFTRCGIDTARCNNCVEK